MITLEIVIQTLYLLKSLHFIGYTHNDLKLENLMIDFEKNGKIKVTLIDFGYAKKIADNSEVDLPFF